MTTYFIGDVHGMLDALDNLIEAISPAPGDRLIFMGDLVDKGPDPVGVVRRVGELIANSDFETVLIKGNHEDRHLRFRRNLSVRPGIAAGQALTSRELSGFHTHARNSDWNILEQSIPFLRLPELGILAVHGGIPGNMVELPDTHDEIDGMSSRDRSRVLQILRTRKLDQETGAFVALGRERPGDPFWAKGYNGRFGHVVFGHQPFFDGIARFPHATGVDTGAVHGGHLTALIISDDGQRSSISVSSDSYMRRKLHFEITAPDYMPLNVV